MRLGLAIGQRIANIYQISHYIWQSFMKTTEPSVKIISISKTVQI